MKLCTNCHKEFWNKQERFSYPLVILAIFSLQLIGCASTFQVPEHQLQHMIALKGNGKSVELNPPEGKSFGEGSPYVGLEEHVEAIVGNIKKEREKDPSRRRILIYVHGGLNGIKSSIETSEELIDLMERKEQRKDGELYYPIIVNWDSSIFEAYKDHLYKVRQGKEVPLWQGLLTSPFYLFWDIGRGIIRYPITLGSQIYKGISPVPKTSQEDLEIYNQEFFKVRPQTDQILMGEDKRKTGILNWMGESVTYVVPGVLKFITTPVLDAFGKPGWDNMVRRTQTVFRTPQEFKPDVDFSDNVSTLFRLEDPSLSPHLMPERSESLNNRPTGGLSQLMEELRNFKKELKGNPKNKAQAYEYKITLIGHSMGTIILNELIRLYGDSRYCDEIDLECLENQKNNAWDKDFEIDEIVYLAAACTIGDFESSVIPYMKQHLGTKFFNLTLHPRADARELYKYDAAPRGSLLEWIDDFASNPSSFMELTLGKWNNAIRAWHIIPEEIRNRVTLKGFGIEDPKFNTIEKNKPQKHGEFNDAAQHFWKPEYWKAPK